MTALLCLMLASSLEIELTAIANEIVRKQQLPYTVSVEAIEMYGAAAEAGSHVHGRHSFITVSPTPANDLDAAGRRWLIAHELAHTEYPCSWARLLSDEKLRACEHQTDALAARWVGSRTVLQGLCQLRASVLRQDPTANVSNLNKRIRRMHDIAQSAP